MITLKTVKVEAGEELEQTPEQPPETAPVQSVDIDFASSVQKFQKLESVEIGPLLRDLRGRRSLRQLEEATGVTYTYLSNIERGKRHPGLKILAKLATYYEVPIRDLLIAAGYPPELDEGRRITGVCLYQTQLSPIATHKVLGIMDPNHSSKRLRSDCS